MSTTVWRYVADEATDTVDHLMGNVRRGDIRIALLAFLLEQDGHGYEAMQYLEAKTNGAWRPSPGSVYPALQQLEDEGLVRSTEQDGRRIFQLTTSGKREAKAKLAERGAPWDHMDEDPPELVDMKKATEELLSAISEVVRVGPAERVTRATDLVRDARKRLYGLLAED